MQGDESSANSTQGAYIMFEWAEPETTTEHFFFLAVLLQSNVTSEQFLCRDAEDGFWLKLTLTYAKPFY